MRTQQELAPQMAPVTDRYEVQLRDPYTEIMAEDQSPEVSGEHDSELGRQFLAIIANEYGGDAFKTFEEAKQAFEQQQQSV